MRATAAGGQATSISASRESQEPVSSVHDELRWLSRDELMDVAWLPADVDLMRNLQTWWGAIFEEH